MEANPPPQGGNIMRLTTKQLIHKAILNTGMTLNDLADETGLTRTQLRSGKLSTETIAELNRLATVRRFHRLEFGLDAAIRRIAFGQPPKVRNEILSLVNKVFAASQQQKSIAKIESRMIPLLIDRLAILEFPSNWSVNHWKNTSNSLIKSINGCIPLSKLNELKMKELSAKLMKQAAEEFVDKFCDLVIPEFKKQEFKKSIMEFKKLITDKWVGKDHTDLGIEFEFPARMQRKPKKGKP